MELCLFMSVSVVLFFKQKTAYEMRISDWSSYVCSSDLKGADVSASDLTLVKPSISQTKVRARTPSINRTITPSATQEPAWIRYVLIAVALLFLGLFLFVPLFAVFAEALHKGWDAYAAAIIEPDAVAAIKLTLLAAAIAVPLDRKSTRLN